MAIVTITTYLSADDVAAAIPSTQLIQMLDDPDNPTGLLNTTLENQLLTRVQGMFDSAIGLRYLLPLQVEDTDAANIANTLRSYALDIFKWLAIKDRSHIDEAYKGVQGTYKDAQAWLDNIAAGKRVLGTSKPIPGAETRAADVQSSGHHGTFTRDRLKGW